MKTLAITIAILTSGLINNTYAGGGNFNIKDKLQKVVKFENNKLPIEKNKTAFVKVSFKIDAQGKIEIIETNYSDKLIKEQLMLKLDELKIEEKHDPNKVYYYNFTFKKM